MAPTEAMETKFLRKDAGDKNILAVELLSIVLGISTFLTYLRGKCVQIWSDNTGAEGSLRKGVGAKDERARGPYCSRFVSIWVQNEWGPL